MSVVSSKQSIGVYNQEYMSSVFPVMETGRHIYPNKAENGTTQQFTSKHKCVSWRSAFCQHKLVVCLVLVVKLIYCNLLCISSRDKRRANIWKKKSQYISQQPSWFLNLGLYFLDSYDTVNRYFTSEPLLGDYICDWFNHIHVHVYSWMYMCEYVCQVKPCTFYWYICML